MPIFYISYHNTCNFNHSYFLFPKWKHMFSVSFYVYYTYLSTRYIIPSIITILMLLLFVSIAETESRSLPICPFWGLFEKLFFFNVCNFFMKKREKTHVFICYFFRISVNFIDTATFVARHIHNNFFLSR